MDVQDDRELAMDAWLRDTLGEGGLVLIQSRVQYRSYMETCRRAAYVIGYGLILVSALIFLLSLANMAAVNARQGREEFRILHILGITRRQYRSMLLLEGMFHYPLSE